MWQVVLVAESDFDHESRDMSLAVHDLTNLLNLHIGQENDSVSNEAVMIRAGDWNLTLDLYKRLIAFAFRNRAQHVPSSFLVERTRKDHATWF